MRLIVTIILMMVVSLFAQNPGDIIVSEIMQNPAAVADASGEWFEVFNTTGADIDIDGWTIRDTDFDSHVINNGGPLVVPAGGFLVLGCNADAGTNGNLTVDYAYPYADINLGNAADEIILETPGAVIIDTVGYDGGTVWPDPTGASMVYTGLPTGDNNDGTNWTTATLREPTYVGPTGDLGSPGTNGSDQSLPIELSSFTARAGDGIVTLKWVTASEINNAGFEVLRAQEQNGQYIPLSSYINNEELEGQVNSNTSTTYKYVDKLVANDITYWYKLVDVDMNGVKAYHGPISATPHASGGEVINTGGRNLPKVFALNQNYPNPFNPKTKITFEVPQLNKGNIDATLFIYNSLGQRVKVLYEGRIAAGTYEMEWDGTNEYGVSLPSGIYYGILKADVFTHTIKMMYIK